ncbi:MAG: RNA methyltransferase [Bacteroidales bacterium]|nr:RNA methyltransferase [Bacteroidales bacterium]MBN2756616.1 RNA methyltransferase [Bacteroidales bacterium]
MSNKEEKFQILAKTLFGLEDVLAKEIEELGGTDIKKLNRAVEYTGDTELLYKSNLYLRTALRILLPIASFKVINQQTLYNGIKEIDWTKYLSVDGSFLIKSFANSIAFNNSTFVALKAKDAIVDQFREKFDKRPSVDKNDPDLQIDVYISENKAIVSLDSSGKPLNQRRYRKSGGEAPLNEVLAAGLILMSAWDKKSNFIDPMCGSGTLLIEAALIATNRPPNLLRTDFSFVNWPSFNKNLWEKIREEAKSNIIEINKKDFKIIGSDINLRSLEITQTNISQAGLSKIISLRHTSFEKFIAPPKSGHIVFNPPYGERLKVKEIESFYAMIGSTLKHKWTDYNAWILTCNLPLLKHIGLKPTTKFKLFNAKLECKFINFTIFEGKKEDLIKN